jgi:hypothetical protein
MSLLLHSRKRGGMGDFEIKAEIPLFGNGVAHLIGSLPVTPLQLLSSFGKYHFCTNIECVEKSKLFVKNSSSVTLIKPSLDNLQSSDPQRTEKILELVTKVEQVLHSNIKPRRCSSDSTGGVWIFYDGQNNPLAVFKPSEEEAGLKSDKPPRRGICPGEGALHEYAVNYLTSDFGSPLTVLVSIFHPVFGEKPTFGSLQQYIPHQCASWDMGSSLFLVEDVHSIGILDIRYLNTDRHGGNILLTKSKTLIPIDHTYCLPETLDETWFEWLQWKQARKPFSDDFKQRLLQIPIEQEMLFLKSCGFPNRSIYNHALANVILRQGVIRNCTVFDLGKICSRIQIDVPAPIEDMYSLFSTSCILDFDQLQNFLTALTHRVEEYFDSHPTLIMSSSSE